MKKKDDTRSTSNNNLMPLRPCEGLEHGEKRECETQDHTDGLRARGDGAGHRELVEQPDRYEQETEDAEGDKQGREGGDTAPAIVVDFRMGCGGFTARYLFVSQ